MSRERWRQRGNTRCIVLHECYACGIEIYSIIFVISFKNYACMFWHSDDIKYVLSNACSQLTINVRCTVYTYNEHSDSE